MIKKNTITPLVLAGIFLLMLGLSFAAVPLYDLFCRVTGFGGTTQVAKEAPKIVLDKIVNVRLDTNVNSELDWSFEVDEKTLDVKPGKVYKIKFSVANLSNEDSSAVASYNVSPSSFGQYFNKLGCFCFEKQTLKPGEKASYDLVFYLDPELVNDPKTKNIEDVTMSYTFFSSDYYKVEKNES
jgi:cytochrome c oxidase assembly protein subunit 11